LFKLGELIQSGVSEQEIVALSVGILVAAVSGYLSIGLLLRFLERRGTHVFALYRILLGLGIAASYGL
jgi:undecaprenyl pyrophosphate phosphatase UppP